MMRSKRIIALLLALVTLTALLSACGEATNELVGSWFSNENDTPVKFTFDKGEKGTLEVHGIPNDLEYSLDGNKITLHSPVLFDGETKTGTYAISEDTLYLTFDNTTKKFQKVK